MQRTSQGGVWGGLWLCVILAQVQWKLGHSCEEYRIHKFVLLFGGTLQPVVDSISLKHV